MRIRTKIFIKNYELEERRQKKGYTQVDFAEIIGMPVQYYQAIESMKRKPNEEQARLIALELDADVDTLFPQGYEKVIGVFQNFENEKIVDYRPAMLEGEQEVRLLEATNAKIMVDKAIQVLSGKERKIIEMRNGLVDGVPRTIEEVGKHFGVTRERIRQVEARAHERMREWMRDRNIKSDEL